MGITVERKYSFEETYKIVNNFCKKYNNKVLYTTVCYKDDTYPTYVTYVKTADGKLITRGNGKGIGKQSLLSSIFEAVEHSFYESYIIKTIIPLKKVFYMDYEKIINNMKFDYSGNPIFENMISNKQSPKLPVLSFKSMTNKKKKLNIPFFMYGPSYPYPALNASEAVFVNSVYMKDGELRSNLLEKDNIENYLSLDSTLKYCSSAGGASGIDKDETLLHAINEVIERNTTSEFLLSAIIYGNYKKYSRIKKNSLDESNKKIAEYIDTNYKTNVAIIDITGSIGIPTIMVYDEYNKFGKETLLTGYGTSTNIEYAIERALLEYKQTIDLVLFDKTLPSGDNYLQVLNKNNVNNFFKKLYYYDFKLLNKIDNKDLNDIKQNSLDLYNIKEPSEMLKIVVQILNNNKYEVYYHIEKVRVKGLDSIYYIKTLIPQMCDITDPGPLRLPNKSMLIKVKEELANVI